MINEFPMLEFCLDDERIDMVENSSCHACCDVADSVAEAFYAGFEAVLLEAIPFMTIEALLANLPVCIITKAIRTEKTVIRAAHDDGDAHFLDSGTDGRGEQRIQILNLHDVRFEFGDFLTDSVNGAWVVDTCEKALDFA